MNRILLAVDDSPAGLAASRTAMQLASALHAEVLALTVLPSIAGGTGVGQQAERRAASALLRYVVDLAATAGVAVETMTQEGQAARVILHQADQWKADLIVLGRSGNSHIGQPYIGTDVKHVLEFADIPLVVVPAR